MAALEVEGDPGGKDPGKGLTPSPALNTIPSPREKPHTSGFFASLPKRHPNFGTMPVVIPKIKGPIYPQS